MDRASSNQSGRIGRCCRVGLLIVAAACAACSSLRKDFVREPSQALAPVFDTPSARYVQQELQRHDSLSGFRLLTRSTNALMSRIALIDQAAHTVDLQYYIFENDDTGRLVAQRLLAAAARGVRVRLLIDDIGADHNREFDALDADPNIEVRVFNPFRTSHPSLPSKIAQFVIEGQRLNRRMHNKSFIVDNVVAIVGGRNIGDAYFDASTELNFSDLDVIAIGAVVPEASRVFDNYWNSDAAYPVHAFRDRHAGAADLEKLRAALKAHARAFAESDYAQATLEQLPNGPTADYRGEWFWGRGDLVADQPEKVEADHDVPAFRIGPQVSAIMDAAQRQLLLITPYFIPGRSGGQYLTAMARRGIDIEALTNSLASTDEPAAYAGYMHYRRELLEGGVRLFELRPAAAGAQAATAFGTSSGISLHAKAIVVDTRYVFIGSMNIDQRSQLLNTEMGVIVDCPPLAEAVARFFARATAPDSAFELRLDGRRVEWVSERNGVTVVYRRPPGATAARRLEVALFRLLPIEGLL